MTRELPLTDFRAVRRILEPEDFAFGEDEGPSTDLVDEETWVELTDLPDTAAITTSNHHGKYLRLLNGLWGDWIKAVGPPYDQDALFSSMLDASEGFQAVTFNMLFGYYRSALASLRLVLEAILVGTYGNIEPGGERYLQWKNGRKELTFTPARKALFKLVGSRPAGWLLGPDRLIATAYKDLCRFAHSNPGASDGDFWEGNGPVYNSRAFVLVLKSALQVYAICYILVSIGRQHLVLPGGSSVLLKLDWLDSRVELLKAFHELGYGSTA
jgi:hypothetical protein